MCQNGYKKWAKNGPNLVQKWSKCQKWQKSTNFDQNWPKMTPKIGTKIGGIIGNLYGNLTKIWPKMAKFGVKFYKNGDFEMPYKQAQNVQKCVFF